MPLSGDDNVFLARRRRMVRSWLPVGSLLLLGLAGLGAWLVSARPMLANPFAVFARISAGTMPEGSLALLAAMAPVLLLMLLLLAVCAVLLAFGAFANERRYLAIIARLSGPPEGHAASSAGRE